MKNDTKTWIITKKIGKDWCVVEQLFRPYKEPIYTVHGAFKHKWDAIKLQKKLLTKRSKLEALENMLEEEKDWLNG